MVFAAAAAAVAATGLRSCLVSKPQQRAGAKPQREPKPTKIEQEAKPSENVEEYLLSTYCVGYNATFLAESQHNKNISA